MKRIGNLWPVITSFDNLHAAYLEARKGKRYRDEVLTYSWRLEENLLQLQRELSDGTYQVGAYRAFKVTEPKERLVMALPFPDRVVQWAIYRNLNPILDRQFIRDSYACRKDKGVHAALDRLQEWLRHAHRNSKETGATWYYLKLDIAKFFYRIDHDILYELLEREIKDRQLLALLEQIIRAGGPFGIPLDGDTNSARLSDVGMPIGNLTSQLFANTYLNSLDHYVKEVLREPFYMRYMDDMIILAPSKTHLHKVKLRSKAI